MRPSDFPRDERLRDPRTPPFRDEQGAYHVFSHVDVMRVLDHVGDPFSRDISSLLGDDHHMSLDFMWARESVTPEGLPGRHGALRGVVEPWFRTRAVRTMEPVIRELAGELIDAIIEQDRGEFDLASELAYRLSIRVICKLTGIELEREHWLREKVDEVDRPSSITDLPRQWDLQAYFWSVVAKRLAAPQDELLDVLVTAWKEGKIDDRELMGYMAGFVIAGTDTTGTNMVNAFSLLAEFGFLENLAANLEDAAAMHAVVEEVLRFGTPFPVLTLMTVRDVAFGDLVVPAGSVLNAWIAAANRDELVNGGVEQADPTVFDPTRSPNHHLALGHGRDYCLGAELARLETRILLEEGLRRLPGLRIDEAKPFNRVAGIVDSVTEAHFRYDRELAHRATKSLSKAVLP